MTFQFLPMKLTIMHQRHKDDKLNIVSVKFVLFVPTEELRNTPPCPLLSSPLLSSLIGPLLFWLAETVKSVSDVVADVATAVI